MTMTLMKIMTTMTTTDNVFLSSGGTMMIMLVMNMSKMILLSPPHPLPPSPYHPVPPSLTVTQSVYQSVALSMAPLSVNVAGRVPRVNNGACVCVWEEGVCVWEEGVCVCVCQCPVD